VDTITSIWVGGIIITIMAIIITITSILTIMITIMITTTIIPITMSMWRWLAARD
jgi:hypothetical protein